ncbi:MAG: Uma2 family endonuclease, partial [Gemmatimonadaceae bacterium]
PDSACDEMVAMKQGICTMIRRAPLPDSNFAEQIMAMPAIRRRWTAMAVRDLTRESSAWSRYELVAGELLVTPSPGLSHQAAVGELFALLHAYTSREQIGTTLVSPADLELLPDTILQPDIFVVPQDLARLEDPSWRDVTSLLLAIEVLSPASMRTDRVIKRDFYMESAVAEYWVIDVDSRAVERWLPANEAPIIERARLSWWLAGATAALVIDLPALFGRIPGRRRIGER